jgi:hypothetical protein
MIKVKMLNDHMLNATPGACTKLYSYLTIFAASKTVLHVMCSWFH